MNLDDFLKQIQLVSCRCLLDAVRFAFLIGPVSRNPVFGHAVHLLSSDLNFQRLAFWSDDRRMKRLIHVGLWHRDIVFKAAGHRFPLGMNRSQNGIAVFDRLDHDAHCKQVINLTELLVKIAHLVINRIDVLWSSVDFAVQMQICDGFFNLRNGFVDILNAFFTL